MCARRILLATADSEKAHAVGSSADEATSAATAGYFNVMP